MKALLQTVATRITAGVLLLVSLLFTQIPLFNYLGLEFSVATAVVAGYTLGLCAIAWLGKRQTSDHWWRSVGRVIGASALLLLIPLGVISVNALWIKNCAFGEGLLIYGLIVFPGVMFSVSLGVVAASVWKRRRRWAFTGLFVVVLLHIAFVGLVRSQIFVFSPIVGFFPGVTYDEDLSFVDRLALYRVCTVAMMFLLLVLARWVNLLREKPGRQPASGAMAGYPRSMKVEISIAAFCMVALAAFAIWSPEMRLASTERSIYDSLGGRYESAHVIIYYPAEQYPPERIVRLALLHEFYFLRIAEELQVRPTSKITSFVYATPEQKQLLVGAGGTNYAKPWLHQIHINAEDIESSLKHELVHVMAGQFGIPFLGIGRNPGLIEGLAMAEEGVAYGETLDQLSAEMLALGMGKHVDRLFSFSGFAQAYPAVSYVQAGSFVQYLIREHGISAFKKYYRTGDAQSVYGASLGELLDKWKSTVASVPPDSQRLRRSAYLFDRPTIFSKVCPRVIARLNDRTGKAVRAHDLEAALRSASESLALTPSPTAMLQYASVLLKLGRCEDLVAFGEAKLADSTWGRAVVPLHLLLGDALWKLSRFQQATLHYESLNALHLSKQMDEACEQRLAAIRINSRDTLIQQYMTTDLGDSVALDALRRQAVRPRSLAGLLRYVMGRKALAARHSRQAIELLQATGPLEGKALQFTKEQSLGLAFYRTGQYQQARIRFWLSLNYSGAEADVKAVEEWIDRCAWMQEWLGTGTVEYEDEVEG